MAAAVAAAVAALAALTLATACETVYEFDDVTVGGDDSGRSRREQSDLQFVRAVYADVLGRTPERYDFVLRVGGVEAGRFVVDEQQFLLGSLDGVGDPAPMRSIIVKGLLHSEEVDVPDRSDIDDPEAFIAEQFRRFLGREPGAYELAAFLAEWNDDPAVGPRTVIRALLGSREYQSL